MGRGHEQVINSRGNPTACQHFKSCLILVFTMEMQIKTMTYHFTLNQLAKIKQCADTKCWRGWRNEDNMVGKCVKWCPLWKLWQYLVELKIHKSYKLEMTPLSIYAKNSHMSMRRLHRALHSTIIAKLKPWVQQAAMVITVAYAYELKLNKKELVSIRINSKTHKTEWKKQIVKIYFCMRYANYM